MIKNLKSQISNFKAVARNTLLSGLIIGGASLLALGCFTSGCGMLGKNAAAPTKLERALFTVTTNLEPRVVTLTNIFTIVQTNVEVVMKTVIQTNQVGIPVAIPVPVTNYSTVTTYTTNTVTQTNMVAVPQLGPGGGSATITTVAGTGAGFFGWGGLVTTVLGGIFGGWMKLRNNALSGQATVLNQTAGALTQNIETLMNVLQSTPQGAAAMPTIKNYLMAHQTQEGVIQSVAGIIEQFVDEPAAQQSAAEIIGAIQTIKS